MNATTDKRLLRFTPVQRLFHIGLVVTFLIQSATGLARMYMNTGWGRTLGSVFGGYESARTVHIVVGVIMICGFALHTVYLLSRIDWKRFPGSIFGPDSLIPRPADLLHFFQHLGWMVGLRKAPAFERWGYWEKFDYWAVFWGMGIIGLTGLLLAYPLWATRYMPGWGLNLAFWVHRIEALLAIGHVFIIHFFIGHLRRHNFPMDRAMFEGSVPLSATAKEKPEWVDRLRASGQLDGALVSAKSGGLLTAYYIAGYAVIAAGVFLVIGALVNMRLVNW
jgi:cytochrome b subunit of formate dehydrogenase